MALLKGIEGTSLPVLNDSRLPLINCISRLFTHVVCWEYVF